MSYFITCCVLAIAGANAALFSITHATSDTTPMNFTTLSVSTNAVNVNEAVQQVTLAGQFEDDLSGYGSIQFYYTSPSGAQVYEGNAASDGVSQFDGSIDIQRYAEPGIWRPTFTVADASGNSQTLTPTELEQLGFNLNITVVSDTPDLEPPVLEAYGDGNLSIDLHSEPEALPISATVTDNRPGQLLVLGRLVSPSGNQVINNVSGYAPPETPTEHILNPTFSQYAEAGTWSTYLTLRDTAGNTTNIDPEDLQALLGDRRDVTVSTDFSDTTPVTINNLSFDAASPEFDSIPVAGAAVSVFADISDNLSGLSGIGYLHYYSQTSGQISETLDMTLDDNNNWRFNAQLPPYAASGLWLPEIITEDIAGNRQTLQHADLLAMGYDLSIDLTQTVSENLVANQTITTDVANQGPTAEQPVQSSVETPVDGTVSIVTLNLESAVSATNGYLLVGQQVNIHAPQATAEAPLTLTFAVEQSMLEPGQDASNLAVFRNGTLIGTCVDQISANPDPCVFSRTTLPSGDIEVKVHTSTASAWTLGFPVTQEHLFGGFKKPLKKAPELNKAEASETIPVKFNFGSGGDPDILIESSPTTQRIDCTTKELIGEPSLALSVNGQGLKIKGNDRYRYNWKTLKKWKGTCRTLTFHFTNGEIETLYFKFKS